MKKNIILSIATMLMSLCIQAQEAPKKLNFDKNGEFKIVQFTDMHLGHVPRGLHHAQHHLQRIHSLQI